jgi:hypothetical protein
MKGFPKQVKLFREDFETLDVDCPQFGEQFCSIMDCPIARALNRRYPTDRVRVYPDSISINRMQMDTGYIGMGRLINAANTMIKTGKPIIIKFDGREKQS